MSREQAWIARYFAPLARHSLAGVRTENFGLRDDAAQLALPRGQVLVCSADMLAAGVHFLPNLPPAKLAERALAVNVSDLAAKAARPLACLVSLGLPPRNAPPRCGAAWLRQFAGGLKKGLARYQLALLGGDMVRAPSLSVAVSILGAVKPQHYLSRLGAQAGDQLYVTGAIGDGLLGLQEARRKRGGQARRHYETPIVPLKFGLGLGGLAHAALDVSDGLWADAERMAQASGKALVLEGARVPLSAAGRAFVKHSGALNGGRLTALLCGGDDYQILFAAPPRAEKSLARLALATKTRCTQIGAVQAGRGVRVRAADGSAWLKRPRQTGYAPFG